LLTDALTACAKQIADAEGVLAQHMRVDAQRHAWVGVAKPGGHDMDRNPGKEQCGRVQVAQIMKAGVGESGSPHRPGKTRPPLSVQADGHVG